MVYAGVCQRPTQLAARQGGRRSGQSDAHERGHYVPPGLAYRLFSLNAIAAFWVAYILTRPFGASFADWAGKAKNLSGLGLGTGYVSVVLAVLIVILVGYLTVTHKSVSDEPENAETGGR
ncbi:MAG TPA: hypothetical protein VJ258_02850 [Candidatus Limnocylindrales bacterium]|jgi:Uncharacterized membrane-anchored protein conserved in bacteria|nr:hypothetical protein [Candidatus Limnocylindrales bacterium]